MQIQFNADQLCRFVESVAASFRDQWGHDILRAAEIINEDHFFGRNRVLYEARKNGHAEFVGDTQLQANLREIAAQMKVILTLLHEHEDEMPIANQAPLCGIRSQGRALQEILARYGMSDVKLPYIERRIAEPVRRVDSNNLGR